MRPVSGVARSTRGRKGVAAGVLCAAAFGGDGSVVSAVSASDDRSGRCKAYGIDGRLSGIGNRRTRYFLWIFNRSHSGFSENADMQKSAAASYLFFCLYQAFIPDKRTGALLSGIKRREKCSDSYGVVFPGRLPVVSGPVVVMDGW